MLNNKILLFVSVVAVIAVITISLLVGNEKKNLSPVINAIPTKASLILETNNFAYLNNKILKNKDLSQMLSEFELTSEFKNNLSILDSLIKTNHIFKKFVSKKTVIISAHLFGENNIDVLFATSFSEKNSFINKFNKAISKLDKNVVKKKIKFAGAEIIKKKFKNDFVFFYTFYEDYFLLSKSEILLQKAIKNINSGSSYYTNENFKTIYKGASNNGDATLYLNYNNFFKSLKKTFNNSFKDKLFLMQKFADWSALKITLRKKEIKLTGHTIIKPEMQYLRMFQDVQPSRSNVIKILPAKTSSFLSFNIGNGSKFKFKYEEYLGGVKMLNDYQIELGSFYKKYRIVEDKNSLYELTNNEIALVYEDVYKNGKEQEVFAFIEFEDESDTEDFLNKLIKNKKSKTLHTINNKEGYTIYKIQEKRLLEMFYGVIFQGINTEFATLIDDFIVFAESKQALKTIINTFEEDKTFKRKSQNYSFINSLSSQSNIFFYFDFFNSKNTIEQILRDKTSKQFANNINVLEKIQGPAIQFISDDYPIYTNIKFTLNSKKQEISETVWEVRLDTLIATKPFIVINHNTAEKEILMQDVANKIYLINKDGKILWRHQLDSKIIGKISQLDYYENNKLQLYFNTENEIHCIDRKGNRLEGYPVKLKSKATNGLVVFDYDNDRDYRIFIATKNKKIYLYNKEGKIVNGWKFNKTKSIVEKEIKLYKNNDKDYIVFRDKTNLYILNRKGETRVKPEANISLSKNNGIYFSKDNSFSKAHFSITNPSGVVYSIFENGKISKTSIKRFSEKHNYLYKDIDGDNISDYIFSDKNEILVFSGKNNKEIYNYSYNENIDNNITLYKFSSTDLRLGTGGKKKIYLINNKGKLCKGFPLLGTGLYSITIFDEDEGFSLIVGNKDNYLYKYSIK